MILLLLGTLQVVVIPLGIPWFTTLHPSLVCPAGFQCLCLASSLSNLPVTHWHYEVYPHKIQLLMPQVWIERWRDVVLVLSSQCSMCVPTVTFEAVSVLHLYRNCVCSQSRSFLFALEFSLKAHAFSFGSWCSPCYQPSGSLCVPRFLRLWLTF